MADGLSDDHVTRMVALLSDGYLDVQMMVSVKTDHTQV